MAAVITEECILLSRLSPYVREITGIISVKFDLTDQLPIQHSALVKQWRKRCGYMGQYVSYL
jgi:hypothetical protein